MNRREFIKEFVRSAVATMLLPGLPRRSTDCVMLTSDLRPYTYGDPDRTKETVETITFADVVFDDGWTESINIGDGVPSVENSWSVTVEFDQKKLLKHAALIDPLAPSGASSGTLRD